MPMKTGKLRTSWCIVLWILPVMAAVLALGIGRIWISPAEIIAAVFESEAALPIHTDGEPILDEKSVQLSLEPEKIRLILT